MGRVNDTAAARQQRYEYVTAFNRTMIEIWKEQIVKLGVINSGTLYRSVRLVHDARDEKVTEIMLEWDFYGYGVYQDRGTGRETPRGNPGDIGRAKVRERRPWLSKKFYSSYCRIRDFFADNLGREFCAAVPRILGSTGF